MTTEDDFENEPVTSRSNAHPAPSRSVRTALGYLCKVLEEDHGTKSGKTALYWHLMVICQQHMAHEQSE